MLHLFNTFNSSLTRSTGPKPSQWVPKVLISAFGSQNHLKEQNKHKLIFIAASIHCPVNNPLQHWWNQCQSISQWETPPWESCSKLPLQSFVSPPPKSFYRLRSKECDTSVSLIIVFLDHAGRAGFSWCAHGKKRSWMRPFVTILHVRLSDFILFIIHWYSDTPSPKMAGFSNAASNPKLCRADIFTVFW